MTVRIFDTEYKLIFIIYIFNKDKLFFNKKFNKNLSKYWVKNEGTIKANSQTDLC